MSNDTEELKEKLIHISGRLSKIIYSGKCFNIHKHFPAQKIERYDERTTYKRLHFTSELFAEKTDIEKRPRM